jgi:hypothetical protein
MAEHFDRVGVFHKPLHWSFTTLARLLLRYAAFLRDRFQGKIVVIIALEWKQ